MKDVREPINNPSEILQEHDSWAPLMKVTLEFVPWILMLLSSPASNLPHSKKLRMCQYWLHHLDFLSEIESAKHEQYKSEIENGFNDNVF